MRLLETLASVFINTFGITQPTDETRRKVSWFIFGLMLLALLVVVAGGSVMYRMLHR